MASHSVEAGRIVFHNLLILIEMPKGNECKDSNERYSQQGSFPYRGKFNQILCLLDAMHQQSNDSSVDSMITNITHCKL